MRSVLMLIAMSGCVEYGISTLDRQDVFTQLPATELDVLLVVDNSGSMQPFQTKLSKNFDTFLTFFEEGDVDYHIGVLTSSVVAVEPYGTACNQAAVNRIPEAGELVDDQFITPDTPNGADVFSKLVNVGVCGSGTEMGLESANRALHGGLDADFLRPDAFLSLIFVSDEEDGSPLPVNDYINAFREVKGARDVGSFNASALVATDVSLCNPRTFVGTEGTRYVDVAKQTGGILGSICEDDFESVVTELSLTSSRLSDRFYLTEFPAVDSLVVIIDDEVVSCADGGWSYQEVEYEGNPEQPAIVFERASMPAPYTEIVVQYNSGTGGAFECGSAR